jgi:hypothetical protein
MPDSRIRPRRGLPLELTGCGGGILFYTGLQGDPRSFYIQSILLLLSYLFLPSGLSFFRRLKLSGLGRVFVGWVREVTTQGVGWSSKETSDLLPPPLNLVLYMYLRIFTYTSNVLIVSFEYMDLILASDTLKNFRFFLRSCLSTDRAPVIKLICSTFQPWRCITVLQVWCSGGRRTGSRMYSWHWRGIVHRRRTTFYSPKYKRSRPYCLRVGGPLFRPAVSVRNFPSRLSLLGSLLWFFYLLPTWGGEPFHGLVSRSISSPVSDSGTVYPRCRM